jgi:hypothetical protein
VSVRKNMPCGGGIRVAGVNVAVGGRSTYDLNCLYQLRIIKY